VGCGSNADDVYRFAGVYTGGFPRATDLPVMQATQANLCRWRRVYYTRAASEFMGTAGP